MPREWNFEVIGEIRGAVRPGRNTYDNPAWDRYCLWRDQINLAKPVGLTEYPAIVRVIAFLPMPASWSKAKKEFFGGRPYVFKPDADNILKGVIDALWAKDECVFNSECKSFFASHSTTGHVRIIVVEHDEAMIHFLKTGKVQK